MDLSKSSQEFERAKEVFPGGVNSPVRAFGSVGGVPPFIASASGSKISDADGNEYIDYVNSWGPAIVGHARAEVVAAVQEQAERGLSFGAPTVQETELGQLIRSALPSMERMRFVSSGTEACMSVLRVARAHTGRSKILKFTGCYHGHADFLLVQAGSGVATLGLPDSPGVPASVASDTLTCPYNSSEDLHKVLAEHGDEIAGIILEPICGNAGMIRATDEFLSVLQEGRSKYGYLLIYDEVMTGFRVAWGGAQILQGVKPDLTALAKVIGGGMPLAAFGGRQDVMDGLAPLGSVYQAGTLSGNPLAVASGHATLSILSKPGVYDQLGKMTKKLTDGMKDVAARHGLPLQTDCEGGMFGFFFRDQPVKNFADASKSDAEIFRAFFHGMLQHGIYLAPSAFEAGFVTLQHTDADIDATLAAADQVMEGLAK